MNDICCREAVPVTIGTLTLYCESFRTSAATVLYEQPTVIGGTVISNKCTKAARLTLSGRVYCGNGSLAVLTELCNMNGSGGYTVEYRGVRFRECIVQGCSAEDKGDDMLYVSMTLASAAPAENVEAAI